jgi:hypothetical protein
MRFSSEQPVLICFNCANLFADLDGEIISCPECMFVSERRVYNQLLKYSADAVEYGYHYRQSYEEDLRNGELDGGYALDFQDVWMFFGLAALSGIVGNATYDAIKAAIKKIAKKNETVEDVSNKTAWQFLDDAEEFRIFIQYIKDYYNYLDSVEPQLRSAILTELVIDKKIETRYGLVLPTVETSNNAHSEKITEKEIVVRSLVQERPDEEQLLEIWKRIEKYL